MQLPDISRRRALAYVLALLAVLALAGRVALKDESPTRAAAPLNLRAEPPPARKVVVHVVADGLNPRIPGREIGELLPRLVRQHVGQAVPARDGVEEDVVGQLGDRVLGGGRIRVVHSVGNRRHRGIPQHRPAGR